MEKQKWAMMKLFSLLLKNRAKDEKQTQQISVELLKYFSRKELIEIINHIYDYVIPEELELVDMENSELLKIIGDDLSIISYVTNKWSKEAVSASLETKTEENNETSNATIESEIDLNPKQELPVNKKKVKRGKGKEYLTFSSNQPNGLLGRAIFNGRFRFSLYFTFFKNKMVQFHQPKVVLKTPISYYGGKQMMLKHILPLIPPHKIYIEPFFGGGSLYWAKEPAPCEVINDVNSNVVNFYQVLKTQGPELEKKIKASLHSRETYKKALFIYDCPRLFSDDPVIRAWAFYVCTNQGFLNKIGSRGYDKEKRSSLVFQNKVEMFNKDLIERIRYTQIEQNDAYKVILSRDREDAFIYCDPPYIGTNQGHYGGYEKEHFIRDLEVLSNIKGKFLLSNFPSSILDEYIKKYNRYVKTFDKPSSASHKNKTGKLKRKTEILVANYPI